MMKHGLDHLREFLSRYRVVTGVLLSGIVISGPGFWMFDSTWASIAVNIFATLIVTPVLLFGVDQTLERVEQRRRAPQHVAIRRTFRSALGQTVNIVSGAAFQERAAMLLAPAFQRKEDINEVTALYEAAEIR